MSIDPLSSFKETLPKEIIKFDWKNQFSNINNLKSDKSKEIDEKFKDKRKELKGKAKEIKEKQKKKLEEAKKKYTEKVGEAKKNAEKALQQQLSSGSRRLKELKSDISQLSCKLGYLTLATSSLAIRTGSELVSITTAAAMVEKGSGVALGKASLKTLRSNLLAQGQELSKTYHECESLMTKLGLERYASVPGVNNLVQTANTILNSSRSLIKLTGANI